MQILLVEDERRFARLLATRLQNAGFSTTLAFSGAQALERIGGAEWDMAIVDVMLPGLDGLSLIDTLRARGVRTPVLILSAKRSVE